MSVLILHADARSIPLADQSVHCCVTSPPYWGLRDYGVVGQLGLEKTPEEYIRVMVDVFREVKRVLRDDGTCWINMGDSYNSGTTVPQKPNQKGCDVGGWNKGGEGLRGRRCDAPSLKVKDLIGVPWMLAFALRADGWYLRSDIIWSKPNPMPESVTDRPTKAHEYIFLLSKSEKYFYDAEAIKEPWTCDRDDMREKGVRTGTADLQQGTNGYSNSEKPNKNERLGKRTYAGFNGRWDEAEANGELGTGRNKRTVWEVGTQPFPEAHFATFPEELIKPCILAGCPDKCCAKCGTPWERIIENGKLISSDGTKETFRPTKATDDPKIKARSEGWTPNHQYEKITTGWEPVCDCKAGTARGTVLDPFMGSGTTALVARNLQCNAIGLELNPAYIEIAKRRLAQEVLEFA